MFLTTKCYHLKLVKKEYNTHPQISYAISFRMCMHACMCIRTHIHKLQFFVKV